MSSMKRFPPRYFYLLSYSEGCYTTNPKMASLNPIQRLFFLVFVALITTCFSVHAQEFPVVNSIDIKGLKRIEETAIKSKISQKVGEPISQEKVNEDIKTIFKMGYFEDARVEIEPFEGGSKLIYVLKEKPTIVRIEFQGNKKFDDAKLKEKIGITTGSIADAVLIQDNANKLMSTKQWSIFSFITSSGYYKKDQMDLDLEKIRDLYFNNGYIKVAVGEPKINLTADKKGMIITIPVSEGPQFKVSSVKFSGNKVFDDNIIKGKITLEPDKPFSKQQLRKDILSIAELYSENGYAVASVTPDLIPDENKNLVEVFLKIDEGDKYRIGKIEISGNTKTRDKVIRREVRLDEGDIFNSKLLKRSYERINNLNFFDNVDIIPKPRSEEKLVDLDVKVKERPTGFLSVGGGYSSVDKLMGLVDLTQGNLFGRGT